MLGKRIITAVLLVPLVIWFTMVSTEPFFASLCLILIAMAAWEWTRLMGLTDSASRLIYVLFIVLYSFMLGRLKAESIYIFVFALFWWACFIHLIRIYPKGTHLWSRSWVIGLLGTQILAASWLALVDIHALFGPEVFVFFLIFIWSADSGAYFIGRAMGERKLIPHVSPGKTIEGVYGGFIAAMIVSIAAGVYFSIGGVNWILWLSVTALTILISVVGDLTISLLKREQNVKDSGHLLPGHGGVLDRIDSILAAAPLFTLGLLLTKISI